MSARPLHQGRISVQAVTEPNPRTRRVRVGGPDLAPALADALPGDAVKVTLSDPDELALARVYTLRNIDRASPAADLDVLLDSAGDGARWAETVRPGAGLSFHGPRYGYRIDADLTHLVLIGDATAEPAISEIVGRLPAGTTAHVVFVDEQSRHRIDLELASQAMVTTSRCHLAGVPEAIDAGSTKDSRYWCAGSGPLVELARRHVRVDRRVPRQAAVFAIYWRPTVPFHRSGRYESAIRETIRNHGLVLDDPHDHDSVEPLTDFQTSPGALTTTVDLLAYLDSHGAGSDEVYEFILDRSRSLAGRGDALPGTLPVPVARLLTLLTRLSGARRAIAIGTFTGTSSVAIARGLPAAGRLVCLDHRPEWTRIAQEAWRRAGVTDLIDAQHGPALDHLRALPLTPAFDLAFLDADKTSYPDHLTELLPRMNDGGLLLADNTLWNGHVADPARDDPGTRAIRAFNDLVTDHSALVSMILPLGDGLTVARLERASAPSPARGRTR